MEAYHEGTFNASELIGCLASTHSEGKKAYASRSSFSNVNPKTRKLDNNQKQICRHVKENPHPVFPAQNTRKQRIIGKAYAHEALHISQPLESPKEQEKKKDSWLQVVPLRLRKALSFATACLLHSMYELFCRVTKRVRSAFDLQRGRKEKTHFSRQNDSRNT